MLSSNQKSKCTLFNHNSYYNKRCPQEQVKVLLHLFFHDEIPNSFICNADNFRSDGDIYKYEQDKNSLMHTMCQEEFILAFHKRIDTIIVDNVFQKANLIMWYYKFAKIRGAKVIVISLTPDITKERPQSWVKAKNINSISMLFESKTITGEQLVPLILGEPSVPLSYKTQVVTKLHERCMHDIECKDIERILLNFDDIRNHHEKLYDQCIDIDPFDNKILYEEDAQQKLSKFNIVDAQQKKVKIVNFNIIDVQNILKHTVKFILEKASLSDAHSEKVYQYNSELTIYKEILDQKLKLKQWNGYCKKTINPEFKHNEIRFHPKYIRFYLQTHPTTESVYEVYREFNM